MGISTSDILTSGILTSGILTSGISTLGISTLGISTLGISTLILDAFSDISSILFSISFIGFFISSAVSPVISATFFTASAVASIASSVPLIILDIPIIGAIIGTSVAKPIPTFKPASPIFFIEPVNVSGIFSIDSLITPVAVFDNSLSSFIISLPFFVCK